jgi:hypothetical protein
MSAAPFPYLGRLLTALAMLGALVAAVGGVGSWGVYSSHRGLLVAWVLTAAAVPLAVRGVSRSGGMSGAALAGLVSAVLAVDVVVASALPPSERLGSAAWNWGSGAILLVAVAVYRRARDAVVAAFAHAGVGVAFAVSAKDWSPTALSVMALTCLVPPLAAAGYIRGYAEVLASRQEAVRVRRQATAARAAEQQARQSVLDLVESIKDEVTQLLESVGSGASSPSQASVRVRARDLSAALRRELDDSRSRGWVLTGPSSRGVVVDVLGSPELLADDGRAATAALVELLGRHPSLSRIGVTVSPAGAGPAVEVTVVASGPQLAPAAADPAVVAAVAGMDGVLWVDQEDGSLVVEAVLLRAGGYPVAAGRAGPTPGRRGAGTGDHVRPIR